MLSPQRFATNCLDLPVASLDRAARDPTAERQRRTPTRECPDPEHWISSVYAQVGLDTQMKHSLDIARQATLVHGLGDLTRQVDMRLHDLASCHTPTHQNN